MEELLPCPFCGGKAFLEVIPPHQHHFVKLPPYGGGAFVECKGCACAMSAKTSGEVIAAWNRRAQHEQSEVVHGRWMGWTTSAYIGLDDVGDPKYADRIHFRCSKCRYGTVVKSAYCPSCGAKMEEVQ